jgi:hypothetical protein
MPASQDFTIQLELPAFRLKYADCRRHVFVPIRLLADDSWLLEPSGVVWWECRDGRREPVTIEERNLVVARVLAAGRERYHLRLHTSVEAAPPPTDETGAPRAGEPSPPDGEDTLHDDPELQCMLDGGPTPDAAGVNRSGDVRGLIMEIEAALARLQPMADVGWDPAMSIARQLRWCRGALNGEIVEAPPGPFSMGLIATREFDMYGSEPELASRINVIERAMNDRLRS